MYKVGVQIMKIRQIRGWKCSKWFKCLWFCNWPHRFVLNLWKQTRYGRTWDSWKFKEEIPVKFFLLLQLYYTVFILDSISEIGRHVRSHLCFLTCLRHSIWSRAVTNWIFTSLKWLIILLHASATYSELPYNISGMITLLTFPNSLSTCPKSLNICVLNRVFFSSLTSRSDCGCIFCPRIPREFWEWTPSPPSHRSGSLKGKLWNVITSV